ncbi:MAG: 50S ribosomal protein L20 [Rickettsiales bacterium]|jgi:large subunit ribosomal protein L20|nr:50S ribosomal protein L20 [Rickettsiales bacterium]
MTRSTNNVATKNRRKAVLEMTKGFRGRSKSCLRIAKEKAFRAMQYSYRDRRNRKRDFRALWIQRINAAVRPLGLTYSRFIDGLGRAGVVLNRKVLSEMAIARPDTFRELAQSLVVGKVE